MKKIRLDLLLVERGLADSRSLAQRLVMAGQVRVNGETVLRSAANVAPDAQIVVESGPPYVSRGGEKLEAAVPANVSDMSELKYEVDGKKVKIGTPQGGNMIFTLLDDGSIQGLMGVKLYKDGKNKKAKK